MANLLQYLNLNFLDLTSSSAGSSKSSAGSKSNAFSGDLKSSSFSSFDDLVAHFSNSGSDKATSKNKNTSRDTRNLNLNKSDRRNFATDTGTGAKVASSVSGNNNIQAQVQATAQNQNAPVPDDELLDDMQSLAEEVLSQLSPESLEKLQSFVLKVAAQFAQLQPAQDGEKLSLDLTSLREQVSELMQDLAGDLGENTVQDLKAHLLAALDDLAAADMTNVGDFLARLNFNPGAGDAFVPENNMPGEPVNIAPDVMLPPAEIGESDNIGNLDSGAVTKLRPAPSDDDDNDDAEDDTAITDELTDILAQPSPDMLVENPITESGADVSELADDSEALAINNDSGNNAMKAFNALFERRAARTEANAGVNAATSHNAADAAELDEDAAKDGLNTGVGTGQSDSGGAKGRTDKITSDANDGDELADGTIERPKDVRADFQTFFESVISSHRLASREAQAPLNLQQDPNYDYTDSETLRVGLTNVVRFVRAQGEQRASVIVDPPALGRLTVELTTNTSGVEASIKVANEQVRQLLQDQFVQLRMSLEQQGVQLTHFTVDVQQDNSNQQQSGEQYQRGQARGISGINGLDDDEEVQEEFRVDLEQGLLYWIA